MRNSFALLAAAAAPLASATLQTSNSGGALIINYCNYDIPMKNVPAMGQGVENGVEVDKVLKAGGVADSHYFTNWIKLNVEGGWSMKLNTLGNWNNIMQFEYTWNDWDVATPIWYDNSFVNGVQSDHPKWQFDCGDGAPKVNAYTYATDDAQGMQAPVPLVSTVTLLLCPQSSGAAATSTAAAPTSAAPTTTTTTTTVAPVSTTSRAAPTSTSSTSCTTTLSTAPKSTRPATTAAATTSFSGYVEVVTEYATQIVTAVVTEIAHVKARRHEHRHPHGHKH